MLVGADLDHLSLFILLYFGITVMKMTTIVDHEEYAFLKGFVMFVGSRSSG